jgi:hypothetical protein
MPELVKKEALRELDRLSKMPVRGADYTVAEPISTGWSRCRGTKRTEE